MHWEDLSMQNLINRTLIPLFLIIACPPSVILIWYTNTHLNGSATRLFDFLSREGLLTGVWKIWEPVFFGSVEAWTMIAAFSILQLLLMRFVPGKRFEGPMTPMGNVPVYKANGVACFFITMALFVLGAVPLNLYKLSVIFDHFGEILGALNLFSLLFCLFLYFKGIYFPSSSDQGSTGNPIFDYYWGTELYPKVLGWDLKQFTNCRFGMMSWGVILISYAAAQAQLYGLSLAMSVAVALQLIYIAKFFLWETGYFCSLDIMHDRAGFYICWGCLVWVPGFYTSPTQYLANQPELISPLVAAAIFVGGIASILINYWADLQRQRARERKEACTIWGKAPKLIHASYINEKGEHCNSVLLASGWWGVSRHFHYLPEITAAFFWSCPGGFDSPMPYLYVGFLTILLGHRAWRDEVRCRSKYGPYWSTYCREVPSLVIPALRIG